MKKLLPFLLPVFCFMPAVLCQADSYLDDTLLDMLRVVEDPDGFTNVRASASTEGKIVRRVTSGSVVVINVASKGAWAEIFQEDATSAKQYIHTSRLRKVDQWKRLEIGDKAQKTSATLKRDGLEMRVSSKPFLAGEHKISRNKEGILSVDGMAPWGCDGTMPRNTLLLGVTLNGDAVKIPVEAARNLYEPNFETLAMLTPSAADKHCLVIMQNSDGAGGYCIIWAFLNGAYAGRAVFTPF